VTELNPAVTASRPTFESVLQQLKAATRFVEIADIRFVDCRCWYGTPAETSVDEVEVTVREQELVVEENTLRSAMTAEFRAPSPLSDNDAEKQKQVHVGARIEVKYGLSPDRDTDSDEAINTFARMNGVQTAWPFFREYLHSSLVRLGLPSFDLPLLKPLDAARLCGLLERPPDDDQAQHKDSEQHGDAKGRPRH
jgi:hypothetical protein